MANQSFDRWIDRYAARIRLGEFLQRAAEAGAAFLFTFGMIVLIVKLLVPQAWPQVLWLAAGALPAGAVAWWLSRKSSRGRWESVARLDSALQTGGLLMMLSERPDADWAQALPQVELAWKRALPRLRPRRCAGYLALPLVFAVGACFVPLRQGTTASVLRNTVAQQAAQELEELLDSIDEEKVFEEQEKEQLKEEIEKLAEETRENPLTHEKWETVDALRERMKVRLESAAMTASQAQEAAQMLSEAGQQEGLELSLERTEQLERELGESIEKLMQKGVFSGAPEELQEQLRRMMKGGKCKLPGAGQERQEALDSLKEFLEKENKKLSDLRKKCSSCKGGNCDKEGECESECEGQCLGTKAGSRPGRGGVTRGRADAELTWGDESDKQGTKFKEVVLPKGLRDDPKDEVVAIQRSAPTEEAAAAAARSAARKVDPAAGETTWERKLNPRHRNAVRKYFGTSAAR